MSEKRDRDGGGLAVLVLAGFLVLSLLAGGGGVAWIFVRQAKQAQMEAIMQMELAVHAAQTARANQAAAQAAAKAAQTAIENQPAASSQTPQPTP